MRVLANKSETNDPGDVQSALGRSARLALILTFSICGVAVFYFGALYLLAH